MIAGHDLDEVGFLIFPKPGTVPTDSLVRELVRQGMESLRAEGGGNPVIPLVAILRERNPDVHTGLTSQGQGHPDQQDRTRQDRRTHRDRRTRQGPRDPAPWGHRKRH